LGKGRHLLIDCKNVPREICMNDRLVLNTLAEAAEKAGATVLNQVRYKFSGDESPAGFTCVVLLDESHCSCHTYADEGMMAVDMFTCGTTDPLDVWKIFNDKIGIQDFTINFQNRFV
jgi:S-adenosylmethionine decarboxylase